MTIQGYKGMASGGAWSNLTPLAASLLLVLAGSAQATESPQTPYLVGNKPKAANVQITPPSPNRKDTVSVSWNYQDVDGDKESDTKVEWFIDNKIVSKDKKYNIPFEAGNKKLEVRVTPRSAQPANPQVGDEVKHSVKIRSDLVGNIVSTPTTEIVKAKDAESMCSSINGRLPSKEELVNIFLDNTSSTQTGKGNNEMCTLYNWPIAKECGSKQNLAYWTNMVKPAVQFDTHRVSIRMDNGTEGYGGHPEADGYLVCMRR